MINDFLNQEKQAIKKSVKKILKRDFSGSFGQAIKNSSYQFMTTFTAKIGSLLFTIIIARLLMPELFGLYSLALSTIIIFSVFAELGIGSTLIKFVSLELSKKQSPNTKGYTDYLFKLKLVLTSIVVVILTSLAYYISNFYYHKPIFYALLAGAFYILFMSLCNFYNQLLQAYNDYKHSFYKEFIFQSLRLILVPITILVTLRYTEQFTLFWIVISLSLCFALTFILLYFCKPKLFGKTIHEIEKKNINNFIFPVTATALTGIFFGYVDIIMLGRYVSPELIGYYEISLALTGTISSFICFSSALFPIFSRLKQQELEKALNKSILITILLTLFSTLFTFIFAKYIILITYGKEYLSSVKLLRLFSLLIIPFSINGLYESYYMVINKPLNLAKFILIAFFLNISLNYIAIIHFLKINQYYVLIGVALATILSKYVYLSLLAITRKRLQNI